MPSNWFIQRTKQQVRYAPNPQEVQRLARQFVLEDTSQKVVLSEFMAQVLSSWALSLNAQSLWFLSAVGNLNLTAYGRSLVDLTLAWLGFWCLGDFTSANICVRGLGKVRGGGVMFNRLETNLVRVCVKTSLLQLYFWSLPLLCILSQP